MVQNLYIAFSNTIDSRNINITMSIEAYYSVNKVRY